MACSTCKNKVNVIKKLPQPEPEVVELTEQDTVHDTVQDVQSAPEDNISDLYRMNFIFRAKKVHLYRGELADLWHKTFKKDFIWANFYQNRLAFEAYLSKNKIKL